MVTAIRDVTVVIPTLGRPLLEDCLASIAAGDAWPAKLVLADQGDNPEVAGWVAALRDRGMDVDHLTSSRRGTAAGMNAALRRVGTPLVAVTHDDCRVGQGWLAALVTRLRAHPGGIITGRVWPEGDEEVPGAITDPDEVVYRRPRLDRDILYPDNMGFPLEVYERVGPFDEHPVLRLAEDAEWQYRALRAGVPIVYAPEVEVRHVAWRDATQRARSYRGYVRSSGGFYGTYIRRGDGFLAMRAGYDLLRGYWMCLRGLVTGHRDLVAYGLAYITQLVPGLVAGLRRGQSSLP